MNGISRETFESMDSKSQMLVLFDYIKESHECSCYLRKQLEFKKKIDWTLSAALGLIGGILSGMGVRIVR